MNEPEWIPVPRLPVTLYADVATLVEQYGQDDVMAALLAIIRQREGYEALQRG